MKRNALDYPDIRINLMVGCIGIVTMLLANLLLIAVAYIPGMVTASTHSKAAGILVLFCLAALAVAVQCNGLLMATMFLFGKPFRTKIYHFLCRGNLRILLLWPARKFYQAAVKA